MSYNPNIPINGELIDADELRDQFNGLKDLIDAVPAGPPGAQGAQGDPGLQGPQGPPFAQVMVDQVLTVDPYQNANVSASFDGNNVHLSFTIPRGFNGNNGADGMQGPPGNVSTGDLSNAIAGTSSNTNAMAMLGGPFTNDPPSLADIETVREKINELITALRR